MVEGTITTTSQETKEGNIMDEAINLDDVGDFSILVDVDSHLDEDFSQFNQSSASGSQRISYAFIIESSLIPRIPLRPLYIFSPTNSKSSSSSLTM